MTAAALALPIPSAHLGHWYVQIAFAVPSLLIIGYMGRDSLRRRRRERRDGKRPGADRKKPRR
jgi:membrane protein implicated in regulation of membrane protease activity